MKVEKIFLVDDHKLFRDGLKLLLNSSKKVKVVGEAANGEEFLKKINDHLDSIILMDIDMPVMNGETATKLALEKYPEMKIIALSMFSENEFYVKMIEAGVKGFLKKNSEISELINAIEKVAAGENFFTSEMLFSIVKNYKSFTNTQNKIEVLSEREIEIIKLVCDGLSNQEIADKLFISKRTVDKHRYNILEKTACKNTASLVIYAIKNEIIKLS